MCLFATSKVDQYKTLFGYRKTLSCQRKVGQHKILFNQRKTLSCQRNIWLDFQESVFILF